MSGCELLSNCIFSGFIDNVAASFQEVLDVVNCFQIVFLVGSLTTRSIELEDQVRL